MDAQIDTTITNPQNKLWGRIHEDVLKSKSLTERALRTYIAITSFAGNKKTCKVRQTKIAKRAGLKSAVSVSSGISLLRKCNIINGIREKGGIYEYTINQSTGFWGKIPINVLTNIRLSFIRLKVLCALSIKTGDNESCFPSRKTISEMCRVSKPNVSHSISDLERLGLISVVRRDHWTLREIDFNYPGYVNGKRKNNSYFINWSISGHQ